MAPCKNCLFNTYAEGCPDDGNAPCTFTNKWRKFIPKDITNPTYNYNAFKPEKARYMAVHELGSFNGKSETWFHCAMTLDDAMSADMAEWPFVVFDRAGNVVGRHLSTKGQIEEDT